MILLCSSIRIMPILRVRGNYRGSRFIEEQREKSRDSAGGGRTRVRPGRGVRQQELADLADDQYLETDGAYSRYAGRWSCPRCVSANAVGAQWLVAGSKRHETV